MGTIVAAVRIAGRAPGQVPPLLTVDRFALFFVVLLAAGALVTTLLCHAYLNRTDEDREEFYVLLLLATLGSCVLAEARHFASLFLGLETLSIALYGMIAYTRAATRAIEAGFKYLVLAAASSAFLLLGMGLLYAGTGTLALASLADAAGRAGSGGTLLPVGVTLVMVGIAFKLGVAPFHLWTPDVYEGAPAPVTGFVATVSKGGALAILLRLLTAVSGGAHGPLLTVVALLAIASMFVGNLLALRQTNVKRMLAYSSIAHLGYILVAILASGSLAVEAAVFYLVAYFVTTLGAFGVVTVLSGRDGECDTFDDYRSLYWRRPWLAALFSGCLFSLAGIPLTAGFVGKYYVVVAAVDGALWLPVLALVVNSALSMYYYLRLLVVMYAEPPETNRPPAGPPVALGGGIALAGLAVLLVWLGIAPNGLMNAIRPVIAALR